jgi:uncharacterized membrane protein (UPF0127 family)/DNA polymerase IIIc chi subunit
VRKIAFPDVVTTEMNSMMDLKGDVYMDPQRETEERHDPFAAHKFTYSDEEMSPVTVIEEGMTGHMDVEDNSYNLADDEDETLVEVSDKDKTIATFGCNVARTIQDKVIGLQSYKGLDKNAGLLFPYKNPSDVMYHMGTVSFPIDIIFVGKDNKIKKICKNIKPGTLGTFGCANVTNVLEIYGGLSDRLGLSKGNIIKFKNSLNNQNLNKMCVSMGIEKNILIKHSSLGRLRVSNWNNFPIFTINNSSLIKTASKDIINILASDLARNFWSDERDISVFCFDDIINPEIIVHSTKPANEDENLFMALGGTAVTSTGNSVAHLNKISFNNKNESILVVGKVMHSFIPHNDESTDLLDFFAKEIAEGKKVVIATSYDNNEILKELLFARAYFQFGAFNKSGQFESVEVLKIHPDSDLLNIAELAHVNYGKDVAIFAPDSIEKAAGVPVSDEIKEQSRRAYKFLDQASKIISKSLENMHKNLAEYDKIKDKVESLPNTKGQFNQSVKRNTKIVREYLVKIRDAIKILNGIKDISTTMEIIESLANSSRVASTDIEEIFDLIEKLESPDFPILLGEKTGNYEKSINDLSATIDRAKDYINSNILGLVVLSS